MEDSLLRNATEQPRPLLQHSHCKPLRTISLATKSQRMGRRRANRASSNLGHILTLNLPPLSRSLRPWQTHRRTTSPPTLLIRRLGFLQNQTTSHTTLPKIRIRREQHLFHRGRSSLAHRKSSRRLLTTIAQSEDDGHSVLNRSELGR